MDTERESIDLRHSKNFETATFALGWFWGPDARFGILDGVIRTRVGYAGGSKENPTYYDLGDHTETLQIDYDPSKISYEDLFNIYWSNLDPYYPPYSRQYMSIVFYHNDLQRKIAMERKTLSEGQHKKKVYVDIVPYTKFYLAENYHQKYYLQLRKELFEELLSTLGNFTNFVNSTTAARINGYVKGYGKSNRLREDIIQFNLSERGRDFLIETVDGYGRWNFV